MAASTAQSSLPPLKFDNIEKLAGQSNYLTWCVVLSTVFDYYSCLDIVQGTELRPTPSTNPDNSAAIATWDSLSKWVKGFILTAVTTEWQHIVSGATDAPAAWKSLQDRFDRCNTSSSLSLFKELINFKCPDSGVLLVHLTNFDQLWSRCKTRVANAGATDALGTGLKTFLQSDTVKASFLMLSLLEDMDNVVDNLQTKMNITYDDVYSRLMDLNSSFSSSASKALSAHAGVQRKRAPSSSNGPKKPLECSWYKSIGLNYIGHEHRLCNKLKAHKANASAPQTTG